MDEQGSHCLEHHWTSLWYRVPIYMSMYEILMCAWHYMKHARESWEYKIWHVKQWYLFKLVLVFQEWVFRYILNDCQFVLSDSPAWVSDGPVVLGLSGKKTLWEHRTLRYRIGPSGIGSVLSGTSLCLVYNLKCIIWVINKVCFLVPNLGLDNREYSKEHNETCFIIFGVQMHHLWILQVWAVRLCRL
jgi:hypothetical protein